MNKTLILVLSLAAAGLLSACEESWPEYVQYVVIPNGGGRIHVRDTSGHCNIGQEFVYYPSMPASLFGGKKQETGCVLHQYEKPIYEGATTTTPYREFKYDSGKSEHYSLYLDMKTRPEPNERGISIKINY